MGHQNFLPTKVLFRAVREEIMKAYNELHIALKWLYLFPFRTVSVFEGSN